MLCLTEEKFGILNQFINRILNSKLNTSQMFSIHEMYYTFRVGYEKKNSKFEFDKVVFDFEFSKRYKDIYDQINYFIIFYEEDFTKNLRLRYNENKNDYNNTVMNFNLNNINKIFNKINLNIKKIKKLNNTFIKTHNNDNILNELLNYDTEELISHFEKKIVMI